MKKEDVVAEIPNVDQVQKLLDELAGDFPGAYDAICKVCDLLGLKRPPDPR